MDLEWNDSERVEEGQIYNYITNMQNIKKLSEEIPKVKDNRKGTVELVLNREFMTGDGEYFREGDTSTWERIEGSSYSRSGPGIAAERRWSNMHDTLSATIL